MWVATSAMMLSLAACVSGSRTVGSANPSPQPPEPVLVWSDDFGGSAGSAPDARKWTIQQGGSGWGNQELECYTDSRQNSSLDGAGHLLITARRDPGHRCSDGNVTEYTSARLSTQTHFTTTYGRLEMYAKVPTVPGAWPAFWGLGSNLPEVSWPQAGEIDIAEVGGNLPSTIHGTLHGPRNTQSGGGAEFVTRTRDLGTNLADGFHLFAVDWSPDSLTWSIDGTSYGTVTKADVTAKGQWVYGHPFFLLLNLAVGGTFPGPPAAAADWPAQFIIDYVRVYS